MPSNIGLLMDVGHLKVSSNSLNFNKGEGLKSLKKYIKGYHLSDNDGIFDSNNKIHKDSWFWDFIDGNQDYYSIEVYRFQTNQLCEQYKLVKELLNKKNELCIKKNT
jgi:sugar phosphate isomerase/epimerase